jgi:hypothetical protein
MSAAGEAIRLAHRRMTADEIAAVGIKDIAGGLQGPGPGGSR